MSILEALFGAKRESSLGSIEVAIVSHDARIAIGLTLRHGGDPKGHTIMFTAQEARDLARDIEEAARQLEAL